MSAQTAIFAVCRQADGLVLNIIVAHQGDRCPVLDCELIEVPDGAECSIGYFWNGTNFTAPLFQNEGLVDGV